MAQENIANARTSNPLLVIVYWAVVGIPLCWGVYKTVQKSVPLFKAPDAVVAAPMASPAAATPAPLAPEVSPVATAAPAGT